MLKYDPILQRSFRDLVERQVTTRVWRSGNRWAPAVVRTQARDIGEGTSFLVSTLIADRRLEAPVMVRWSTRQAIYDGVLEFGDGLTVIVENKPKAGNVWTEQLSPARDSVTGEVDSIRLHPKAISLEWAEVAEEVLRYADSPMAGFAGREMARDFLALVEEVHPTLSPYRTFKLALGRPEAVDRRILSLLDDLATQTGYEVRLRAGGQPYLVRPRKIAQEVHLEVLERGPKLALRLSMWPADTVSQARAFFAAVDAEAFMNLGDQGWAIEPKFHLSFMSSQLVHGTTTIDIVAYFDRFAHDPGRYGKKPADPATLGPLVEEWLDFGLITRADAEEIDRHFLQTRREHVNVIPGFRVLREWPMDEVMAWEEDGALERRLLEAMRVPLATWGEGIPETPGRPTP